MTSEQPANASRGELRRKRRRRSGPADGGHRPGKAAGWLNRCAAVAVALGVGLWVVATRGYYVPSGSMEPSLREGDQFCADVLFAARRSPRRGEIWVLSNPHVDENGPTLVKRVIGLPGEVVEVRAGHVWIDGRALHEGYCKEAPAYTTAPRRLGAGRYWVLGDNRNDSEDSHVWGPLDRERFIGRAFFRYAPLNRIGAL